MQANATMPRIPLAVALPATAAPPTAPPRPGRSRWWLLPWLALFLWHGWLTLTLFGTDQPWLHLLDEQPLTSGAHPLHLYHGTLGARSFLHNGELCCYDPAFQAGYPKTPVYDSGSRPAELFLVLVGGHHPVRAYKIGVAACSLLLPLALLACVQNLGFSRRTLFLTTFLGLCVWWEDACQRLLVAGDLDLLLAGLMLLTHMGLLIRFDKRPGLLTWLGIALTGFLAWFAQPICAVLVLPLFLLYYLHVGPRHEMLWHVSLVGGLLVAVACNVFWLNDWVRYWWLRSPPVASEWLLTDRTPRAVWDSPLWGGPLDRALNLVLLALALAGAYLCYRRGERGTVRLLAVGSLTLFALALGGLLHEQLGRLQTTLLYLPALLLALPLAAHALEQGWQSLTQKIRWAWVILLPFIALAALGASTVPALHQRATAARPLPQGLNPAQEEVVATLRTHTTHEARILWEDTPDTGSWTALLPWWTGRSFIGGIDPHNTIEPSACQLSDQRLLGRPLDDWTDAELAEYCHRYNVGWVAARTPQTIARFRRWPLAAATANLPGDHPGVLFTLRRPRTFLLKGKARIFKAEGGTVTLCDVVPEDGEIVLSLHYHAPVTASPNRVRVERDLDSRDPIPLIRLRVDGPVARITLTFTH